MDLDTYLRRKGAKTLTVIAKEAGVTPGRLSQLRNSTEWPAELALKVEDATFGAVDASELSPTIAKARAHH